MQANIVEDLAWEREGSDWPNREHSQFVRADGIRWHCQLYGDGPRVLLLHGAGAATHSWRDFGPELASHFRVLAVDLPGHGFSETLPGSRLSLDGVSTALLALLETLNFDPELTVGHSAGAALACHLALFRGLSPRKLASLNGAHLPLRGYPSWLYGPIAGFIANSRRLPRWFARRACDRKVVDRLMRNTGSNIDPEGFEFYWRLARSPAHVSAALGLMAHWDVRPIEQSLNKLKQPLLLITGSNDSTVPPADSLRVHDRVAGSTHVSQDSLGHLAHEEDSAGTAAVVRDFWFS